MQVLIDFLPSRFCSKFGKEASGCPVHHVLFEGKICLSDLSKKKKKAKKDKPQGQILKKIGKKDHAFMDINNF